MTLGRLQGLAQDLSQRDLDIIATLARVRVATFRQLERLHFAGHPPDSAARLCRRTLARLVEERQVLARLDRRIGGVRAGSEGFVYALDTAGQRLAGARGPAGGPRPRRPWTPSVRFIDHVLAVSEIYTCLRELDRGPGVDLIQFQAEPAAWRRFLGPGGGVAVLKPDAYVVLGLGDYEHHYFIEVDRATESPAAVGRQLTAYRHYWATGTEQGRIGLFPIVVIAVPDARRHQAITEVAARQPAETWSIFRVVIAEGLVDLVTGDSS
ncbi:MAG: replication-relaxation family protein [Actinomycetota bacterium]